MSEQSARSELLLDEAAVDEVTGQEEPRDLSFYDVVGGSEPVHQVIQRFYDAVLDDAGLRHYFEGVDMVKQRRHLALLVIQLLGGPKEYDGRELGKAHRGLHVTEADYDKVVGHLVSALQGGGVPAGIIASLGETVASVRPLIVDDGVEARI